MKCINCGYDNNENARFCQGCGSALVFVQNPLAEQILQLLKDNRFTVLCIIYSISIGFSLVSGSIPIIRILMTIFLWLIFDQSRKGIIALNYMRCISGTIFASYVVKWVLCCIIALCGLILAILSLSMNATNFWNMFYPDIESYINDYLGAFGFITNSFLLLFSVALIIGAIIGIFLNVLGRRSIHRFAQSVYKNLEDGQVNLAKRGTAQTWLMVFGILDAIYAVFDLAGGNMASFLERGCLSATLIMSSILVNKYFSNLK